MLLEKYTPQSIGSMLGNRRQAEEVSSWIKSWSSGAMLLSGPPGTGKTLAVRLAAKGFGYEVVEEAFPQASSQSSIFFKGKVFLLERCAPEFIKKSRFPVVIEMEDPYDTQNGRLLARACKTVKFEKVRHDIIESLLIKIDEKEGLGLGRKEISQLARSSNGDVRAALLDIEFGHGYRDSTESIFNTLKIIFRTRSIDNAMSAAAAAPPDELFAWLEENIAEEYSGDGLAAAYDSLSKADIFRQRIIKRQSWSLQKYFRDIAVLGVALGGSGRSGFVSYKPPRFIRRQAAPELAAGMHMSVKKAAQYRDFIEKIASAQVHTEAHASSSHLLSPSKM